MEEIWKNIIGFEKFYQISNLGNVKSFGNVIKYCKSKKEIINYINK